jgi:3-oxoacyl-[acyl-carrier protein] reductase
MKLECWVALVTGGGSGIGRAIALLFVEGGARVIVNDVNLQAAEETVEQMVPAKEGGRAIKADVSSVADVKAMFAEIDARYGKLDILVNNAGIAEPDSNKFAELTRRGEARLAEVMSGRKIETHWDVSQQLSDEEWHRMIGVHLNGTFVCTRQALKLTGRKNSGVIINMSSTAALRGIPLASHYGAAKGGILGFTRSVAQEVASRNIRVNAICPGWVETPMTQAVTPLFRASLTGQIPLARWARSRGRWPRLHCSWLRTTARISAANGYRPMEVCSSDKQAIKVATRCEQVLVDGSILRLMERFRFFGKDSAFPATGA